MTDLSPAAQAVLDAFAADNYGVWLEGDPERLAAALRAAADQAIGDRCQNELEKRIYDRLHRIAAELEAHS